MPNPAFVAMYHPSLDNRQALVSYQSIDDHAAKGWLLVNGNTPAPTLPDGALNVTTADARYLKTADIPTSAAVKSASVAAVKTAITAGDIQVASTPAAGSITPAQLNFRPAKALIATRPRETGLTLKRVGNGAPIMSVSTQNMAPGKTAATTMYWPCLIDARATIGASALDNWYLLFSTDHASDQGGIFLATAPNWYGPFTGQGRVYSDTVSGTQTETPTAVWLPAEQQFAVLYQNYGVTGAVGQQSTVLATSPTLLAGSFTRVGTAIDIPPNGAVPGNGHTGYASVHSDGGVFYAHHLMGGLNPSLAGISQSVDMRTWWTDTRPLAWAVDQVGNGVHRIAWGGTQVVRWQGSLWAIGTLTNGAAGTDPRDGRFWTARLSEDRRHIIGKPTINLYPTVGQETANIRSLFATVTEAGELAVIYQTDDNFFAATAA